MRQADLLYAAWTCGIAPLFGGMGSWNGMPAGVTDSGEYQALSSQLPRNLQACMLAALNGQPYRQ